MIIGIMDVGLVGIALLATGLVLPGLTVLGVAGLAILILGWRARAGEAPHCRKCNFDLSGLGTPEQCPECGRGLTHSRAIRRGAPRKRRSLVLAGGAVLFASLVALGWVFASTQTQWNKYKPTFLLFQEARLLGEAASGSAIDELIRRDTVSPLDARALQALIDAALDETETFDSRNPNRWARLVAHAGSRDMLTPEQRSRYLEWILADAELVMQKHHLAGEPIGKGAFLEFPRVQSSHVIPLWLTWTAVPVEARLDDKPLTLGPSAEYASIKGRKAQQSYVSGYLPEKPLPAVAEFTAPPGEHELAVRWKLDVWLLATQAWRGRPEAPPDFEREVEVAGSLIVHETVEEMLTLVGPEDDVDPPQLRVTQPWNVRQGATKLSVSVSRGRTDSPATVCGRIVVLTPDGDVQLRHTHSDEPFVLEVRPLHGVGGEAAWPDLPRRDSIDIRIDPDHEAAARRGVVDRPLWNEPIILRDVPLTWPDEPEPDDP